MTRHNHRFTRRSVLSSAIALGATGTGLALYSQRSQATVTPEFAVPDSKLVDEDGQPSGIWLFASGNWAYRVNTDVGEYALALFTRDINGSFHVVDVVETPTSLKENSGTFDLGGDLLATDAWSAADFTAPGPGKSITRNVPVGVLLRVLDPGGSLITDGRSTATASIMVEGKALSATIGGTGEVQFQADDGDPTPTSTL